LSNALANPLLSVDPDLNLGDFNSSSVNGIDLSAITDNKPLPVVEGDDGNLYLSNAYYTPSGWKTDPDFSEPVYYYTQSSELGEVYDWRFELNEDGTIDQPGGWFTEGQIAEFWEADQGMGYFQEQHSHIDFDTYMNFVKESSGLYTDGLFALEDTSSMPAPDPAAYQSLLQKYGIQSQFQNNDGDIFIFNGSNYTKVFKVEDEIDYGRALWGIGLSLMGAQFGQFLMGKLSAASVGLGGPLGNGMLDAIVRDFGKYIGGFGGGGAGAATAQTYGDIINDPNWANVITNLSAANNNNGGNNNNQNNQTNYEGIDQGDGTSIWNAFGLPPGYIYDQVRNVVIHEESGKEYAIDPNPWGIRVTLPNPVGDNTGGGGGATSSAASSSTSSTASSASSSSSGAPASDASADEWREYADELKRQGIEGIDLIGALQNAGISSQTFRSLNQDGWSIYSEPTVKANSPAPQLVIYDGDPKLLDPNGPWQPGGTEFDRTDPANPRKYYVWTNSATGEEWKIYDDELGSSDQVADYEAYIKDRLPDVTEEEQAFIRRLIELGDPIGQAIEDVVASRGDLNTVAEPETITVTTPSGNVTVPNPNATTTTVRQVGDSCSVGSYEGTVQTAPSGNLFCDMSASLPAASSSSSSSTTTTPASTPKPGDACELADGTNGTFDDNMTCQSGSGTGSTTTTVVTPTWNTNPATASTSTTSSTAPATNTSSTTSSPASSTATNSTSTTTTTTSVSPSATATTAATTAGVFTVGASTWPTSSTTNTQGSNGGGSSGSNGNGSNGNNGDGNNGDGGDGDGGEGGNGGSQGSRELPQTKGSWTNRWTPLYEETRFRRFNKDRDGKSMAVPYQQNANLAAPDLTGQRMALFSDLAKGLS